jgi:hypothetical protein
LNRSLSALCVAVLAATAVAQDLPGAEGPSTGPRLGDGPHEIATTTSAARRFVLPARRVALAPLDATPLLDEDALVASMPALKIAPRVAVTRWFHELRAPRRLVAGASGVASMPDGSLVWTAEISSPGAVGVRLHVSRLELPEGATLVVLNAADSSEAYGPFTGGGPRGAGERFLPTVFGDTARVEISVPRESTRAPILFSVDRAAHRYRERAAGMEDLRVGVPTKSGTCENDVVCDANYVQDVARGVATMEISATDGAVYLCSGALLNDSDPATSIPYFLTAHHCISTEYDANHTEFYFDYRAATCGGAAPKLSSVPRVSGATLLATSSTSDYTLLRLTGALPANRFFCGWSAGRQNTGESVVGVHHPGGAKMSISYGTMLDPDGNFHQVQWSSGVTAPGSSGSPLFNPQKQVIGQLYGGSSSCSFRSGIDEYGRFDRTYASLRTWLGDAPTTSNDDGNDPLDDTLAGATELVPTYFDQSHGPHSLSKTDTADWFSMFLVGGAHYRFFSTGVDDVQAVLYADQLASVVAASDDDGGGSGQFSIDFVPTESATYFLKVSTPVSGSAAEYTLYFTQVRQNLLRPPAPVRGLRKALAGSIVKLHWLDAARNEAGYYVDISENDGQSWTRAGELPRNSRAFSHDPGPGHRLYRVGAWNESGTVRWRQVAVTIVDPNQLDALDPTDDLGDNATVLSPADAGLTPTHTLSRADAEDWYQIDLVAGASYMFQTTGTGDTYGEIFADPAGDELLAYNDDAGAGRNFRIWFRPPASATYWVRVSPRVDGSVLSYALQWRKR